MADSVANVLMNYSRVMPDPGGSLAKGFARGQRNKIADERTKLEGRRTEIAEQRNTREEAADKRAIELAEHKQLAGVAASADTPEKWANAQELGFLPEKMKFESREPYIMGVMTETEKLNREKMSFTKGQTGVENKMAERKQAEVERSNRAGEAIDSNKAAKTGQAKGGTGARRLSTGDEGYIAKQVAAAFDGTYDVATDTYTYKDSASRRKAIKMKKDAARFAANNPGMELSMAVEQAAIRNGINVDNFGDQTAEPEVSRETMVPARPSKDYSTLY